MFKKLIVSALLVSVVLANAGEKAHNFTLPGIAKKSKKVTMPKKGVVLVNMWASWCPGCKKEMPLLDKIATKYKKKKLKIIAVNVDNKQKSAQKYLKKYMKKLGKKSNIYFAYDKTKGVTKAYKVRAFPMTILVKNGKVIKEYVGSFNASNEADLLADINKALK